MANSTLFRKCAKKGVFGAVRIFLPFLDNFGLQNYQILFTLIFVSFSGSYPTQIPAVYDTNNTSKVNKFNFGKIPMKLIPHHTLFLAEV